MEEEMDMDNITGMHALGWSSEEAVQYMMKHTAASEDNVRAEVY